MKEYGPEREKIFILYTKLIAGKQWKDLEEEAGMSRQWFDKKRSEYGLPPPADVRRSKRNKENPQSHTREEILKRRKEQGFYTMGEAAEKIGITVGVLAVQQRKGIIKGEREGVNIFIHEQDIEKYVASHRRKTLDGNSSIGFMTVQEAVALSEKSIATIYSDIQKGKLEASRTGSTILIPKSSFTKWMTAREDQEKKNIDTREIIAAYRSMTNGADWQSLEIASKMSQKSFDKRRSALHLPPISQVRKEKEFANR